MIDRTLLSGRTKSYKTLDDFVAALKHEGVVSCLDDLYANSQLLAAVFEGWINQTQLGCLFASKMISDKAKWSIDWRPVVFEGQLGQEAIHKRLSVNLREGTSPDALCAIFPAVKSEDDLVSLINTLCQSPQWQWEEIPNNEGDELLIGLRWMFPNGITGSWVLGFGPLQTMPFTRQAPFTALVFRTRRSGRQYPEGMMDAVHLADLKVPEQEQFQETWRATEKLKRELLNGELEHCARARVTFSIRAERRSELPSPSEYCWGKQTVFTTGYEGRTGEQLISALKAKGIDMLLDCRLIPNSRGKPAFAKKNLKQACETNQIEYVHCRELGTPKAILQRVRESGGYYAGEMDEYRDHLAANPNALQFAAELAISQSTCLLCSEADPTNCHRTVIADAIRDRHGLRVEHLLPDGHAGGR